MFLCYLVRPIHIHEHQKQGKIIVKSPVNLLINECVGRHPRYRSINAIVFRPLHIQTAESVMCDFMHADRCRTGSLIVPHNNNMFNNRQFLVYAGVCVFTLHVKYDFSNTNQTLKWFYRHRFKKFDSIYANSEPNWLYLQNIHHYSSKSST